MLGLVVRGKDYPGVASYPQWLHLYSLVPISHCHYVSDDEAFLGCINMRNIFHKCLFSTFLDTVCIQMCAGRCCASRIDYIPIPMVTCFLFLCLVKFEVL